LFLIEESANQTPMVQPADFLDENLPDGSVVLRFSGSLVIANIGDIDTRLRALASNVNRIDLSQIDHMDTVGAWLIYRTARQFDAQIIGGSAATQSLIATIGNASDDEVHHPMHASPISKLLNETGKGVINAFTTSIALLGFLGQIVAAWFALLLHPRRFRFHSMIQHFDMVGVRALGIIGLMSLLIGIVIAQQGAVQLRQFGVEVWTVNLIGRLTLRELGILMTAIMVAGRSGSAFAAQLGTMKITEEIDAMRTIGVSPIESLVVPRVLSTIFMMPLLGIYASIFALIGGGLFCWASLDLPPQTYIARLREVTPVKDLYIGLIKAPVFGAIIAMTGCFQGLQVKGNSEQVGMKTTAAVVQAIFLVIVVDAFFAVFFSSIGWN
jgi:phospholipid/cholesterol/gamma-HCH transport system permease protein